MVDTRKSVKHDPCCQASDYSQVPEAWQRALERDIPPELTKWNKLSGAGLKPLTLFLLLQYATPENQKAKETRINELVVLFDRLIYAQKKLVENEGGPRDGLFRERARRARARIYKERFPGSNRETFADLLYRRIPRKPDLAWWKSWPSRYRAVLIKSSLKRSLLEPKFYLFLLRGLARQYGVNLSLANLVLLADYAVEAFKTTQKAGPGPYVTDSLQRETLSRFLTRLQPLEGPILRDTAAVLTHILPLDKN
jgi:hypothetical protein